MLRRILSLFRNLFRRERVDDLLEEELRSAVEILAREKIQIGIDPKEARRQALIELGGAEQVKEKVREIRTGRLIEDIWLDIRYGVRMLRKNPGFTAVAVLTLALGIGANTAIFSFVHALFIGDLPVSQPNRLILIQGIGSYPDFQDLRDQNEVFSSLTAFSGANLNLVGDDETERIAVEIVTENYFNVLSLSPYLGNMFQTDEQVAPGAYPYVVLSHSAWRGRFRSDPSIVGKILNLGGIDFEILGVAPPEFHSIVLGEQPELWAPFLMHERLLGTTPQRIAERCGYRCLADCNRGFPLRKRKRT